MGRDWRDDRIAELEGQLRERDATIAELRETVAKLLTRVAELEEQVRKSSRNSSKPPSSDGPAPPPRPKKPPTGRKPGGQPGHERHSRELVPQEKVSEIVACIPDICDGCGRRLRGHDSEPHRHQVFELPEVEPLVTEYQQHSLGCTCGHTTQGKLPPGTPTRTVGPSVDAVVAILMGIYRLSKRQVPDLMHDLFGLRMSVGAVIGCQQAASTAIEAPFAEARAYVAEQPVKYVDETGWREGAKRARAWLWVAVTPLVAVFLIQARRNAKAARSLLISTVGIIVTDRHGAYNEWGDLWRQFCWAHLKRDIQVFVERGYDSARIGVAMLEEVSRMFAWWHRVRDGTLARTTFQVYMRAVRRRFEALLAEGAALPHSRTSKTCANLLKHADALWTFVRVEGVEPTNNTAEQAVRHAVIMRKLSYGTHSEDGSRFIERILTVHATLRRQDLNILEFMRAACRAKLHNKPAPSLLPVPQRKSALAIAA